MNTTLSLNMQIADEIRYRIETEQYAPGEKLPSERELSAIFRVQRLTLREGLQSLIQEGIVEKIGRQGYFVCAKRIFHSAYKICSTTQYLLKDSSYRVQTMDCIRIEVNLPMVKKMRLPLGTPVYLVARKCYLEDEVIEIEKDYLEVSRYPDFEKKYVTGTSIYKTIEKYYNVFIVSSNQEIRPMKATKELSELLNIPRGEMLIYRSGMEADRDGNEIYFSETFSKYQKVGFRDFG